jgi:type IV secretion system protein VirD4
MYFLSRLLLMFSCAVPAYCLTLGVVLAWPVSALVLAGILAAIAAHRRRGGRLTTLGSARFANADDIRTGMLDANSGLILGRLVEGSDGKKELLPRLQGLFARQISAKEACQQFWMPARLAKNQLVRLANAVHVAVFCPTGGGKGVSCVIPFLLNCPDSCVVVDFKGENALRTAAHRRKQFGHQIVLLDPFKVVTDKPDCFNPLDFIDKDSPTAIDECNDLAKALVIRTGEEREPHWLDSSEMWLSAVLATIVQYGGPETRSLQTVRDILSNPQKLDMAIKLMCESDCWGGMLARMGGQLTYFVEREKNSTLTTTGRFIRHLDSLAVAESTKASSFDPAKLRTGKLSVYLILPPEHMRAQSPLLRIWISSLLMAVVKGGLQERNLVHFILDEFAAVGHLDCIDDAIDKFRGFGIRLQMYLQSMGQLKKCFPEDEGRTLLSNAVQVYAGVNEYQTADVVSSRCGEATIVVTSGGTSTGSSTSWSSSQQGPQHGSGGSYNSSSNWQQMARKLLKPEEIMALHPRLAITLAPGMPPIMTWLARYYEEPNLGRQPGWVKRSLTACCVFAASLAFCAVALGAAAVLTREVDATIKTRQEAPFGPRREFNFNHR